METKIREKKACFFCETLEKTSLINTNCEKNNSHSQQLYLCENHITECAFCSKEKLFEEEKLLSSSQLLTFISFETQFYQNSTYFNQVCFNEEKDEAFIKYIFPQQSQEGSFNIYRYAAINSISGKKGEFIISGGCFEDEVKIFDCSKENYIFKLNEISEEKKNVFCYSIEILPDNLIARASHKVFINKDNKILIVGGFNGQDFLNSCEVLTNFKDKNCQWENAPSLTCPRSQLSGFIYKEFVYIFGGFSGNLKQENSFERINFEKLDEWKNFQVKNLELINKMSECLIMNYQENSVIILGGSDGNNSSNEIFKLEEEEVNDKGGEWKISKIKKNMFFSRAAFAGCFNKFKDTIIIVGGDNEVQPSSIETLNIEDGICGKIEINNCFNNGFHIQFI